MSDPFDDLLRARLEALTAAIRVEPLPPPGVARPSRRLRSSRAVLAGAGMVIVIALGSTAAYIGLNQPSARGGAFAPGGPLHCSGVDRLTPIQASRAIAELGLIARWQLDDPAAGTSTSTDVPPDHGIIIDALALDERTVLVLVDLARTEPIAPRPCP